MRRRPGAPHGQAIRGQVIESHLGAAQGWRPAARDRLPSERSVVLGRNGDPLVAATPGPRAARRDCTRALASTQRGDMTHHRTAFINTFFTAVALGGNPPLAGRRPRGPSIVIVHAPAGLVPCLGP